MVEVNKVISVVASLVRINLISMRDFFELLRSRKRAFEVNIVEPRVQK
jgi:hypothetical protein